MRFVLAATGPSTLVLRKSRRHGQSVLLSERFPALYPVSVAAHRTARSIRWLLDRKQLPARDPVVSAEYSVTRHSSPIYRRLAGVDMQLQENKRKNLALAFKGIKELIVAQKRALATL